MTELPTGTVTFLFTDLEGSTRLWEEHPDAMQRALARHDEILRDAIERTTARRQDHRRRRPRCVRDRAGRGRAARATRSSRCVEAWGDDRAIAGPDGHPHRPGGAARRRLLRHRGEPGRTADVRRRTVDRSWCRWRPSELVARRSPTVRPLRSRRASSPRSRHAERVFQLCGPASGRDFPPLQSLDAFPRQPAAPAHSFVGREDEIDRVASVAASGWSRSPASVGSARPASPSRSRPRCSRSCPRCMVLRACDGDR